MALAASEELLSSTSERPKGLQARTSASLEKAWQSEPSTSSEAAQVLDKAKVLLKESEC